LYISWWYAASVSPTNWIQSRNWRAGMVDLFARNGAFKVSKDVTVWLQALLSAAGVP
jgi:hypothetical protein